MMKKMIAALPIALVIAASTQLYKIIKPLYINCSNDSTAEIFITIFAVIAAPILLTATTAIILTRWYRQPVKKQNSNAAIDKQNAYVSKTKTIQQLPSKQKGKKSAVLLAQINDALAAYMRYDQDTPEHKQTVEQIMTEINTILNHYIAYPDVFYIELQDRYVEYNNAYYYAEQHHTETIQLIHQAVYRAKNISPTLQTELLALIYETIHEIHQRIINQLAHDWIYGQLREQIQKPKDKTP